MAKLMLENTSFIKEPGTMIIIWVLVCIYVVLKRNPSPNKGKKLNEEWRKSLAESHKGQVAWNKGKKMSDEYREKCKDRPQNKLIGEVGKKFKGKHWGISKWKTRMV